MDLEKCPRCGIAWTGGDKCPHCKFVPIGVGLDKSTKKKKKKKRSYAEPGSSKSLFGFVFILMLGGAAYVYQPWKDDWEMLRSLTGKGRHHSLVGRWQVIKTVATNPEKAWVAKDTIQSGSLLFTDKGIVKIDLLNDHSETVANGKFEQQGTIVAMRDVRTTGDTGDQIPPVISMNLAWTGEDTVVVMDKSQAIYLKRAKKNGNPLKFMQMALKKGVKPDESMVPEQMRGVIGSMKRSLEEAGSDSESSGAASGSSDNSGAATGSSEN